MNKINELEQKPIGRLLIQYSIPATLSLMVSSLYMIIDRIFIGNIPRTGVLALTGVGLTAPITTIILALSALIAFGASSTISIRLGEQRKDAAEKAAGNAISYTFIVSLLLTALFFIFENPILQLLGITGEAGPYAKAYISIIVMGTIVNMFSFVFPIIIRADGNPLYSALITLIGCILNIILDAFTVFVLQMGIQGTAIATVLAQLISTIMGFLYFAKGKPSLTLSFQSLIPQKDTLKSIFRIGLVPCANQLSVSIAQLVGNYSLFLHGGELSIGAMTAIRSIVQLFMMGVYGIGQGFQPIVGYNFAKKNYSRAFKALRLAFIWSLAILVLGEIIIQIIPDKLISLFINDTALQALAVNGIKKFSIVLPLGAFVAVLSGFMMMTNRIKSSIFLNVSYQIVISASAIYLLPLAIGTNGLWYSQPVTDVIASVLATFLFIKGYRPILKLQNSVKE